MKCGAWRKQLYMLLDGALDERRKAELERHLSACAACRKEKEQIMAFLAALPARSDVAPAPFLMAKIRRRIAGEQPASLSRMRWVRSWAAAAIVAVTLFTGNLLGGTLWSYLNGTHDASSGTAFASSMGLNELGDAPEGSLADLYNSIAEG